MSGTEPESLVTANSQQRRCQTENLNSYSSLIIHLFFFGPELLLGVTSVRRKDLANNRY